MIDEKKIEEAADKECGGLALAKEGFKSGINWFLGNLWHPASEEPKDDKRLIVERISSDGEKCITGDSSKTLYSSWQYKVSRENITRWLYIKDLMKGGSNG